ncbi:MAG: hypothetical protein RR573_07595 [Oscillospiraceae bacterium]
MGIKHKLFKTILAFTLLATILSVNTFAAAPNTSISSDTRKTANSSISERITHSYNKTVSITYNKFDEVPSTIYYEEYNDSFKAWFSGRLSVSNVTIMPGGKYEASFNGTLYGTI